MGKEAAMSFGAHSEVGRLHKVMVHRPGLEHTRLTPSSSPRSGEAARS